MAEQQKTFSSNLGVILAAVGSAVGLGNIWRFPYILGKYGGGAFLLVYLFFVFFIGMVLMMTEFVIGRRSRHTPIKAFSSLAPGKKGWWLVGLLGIVACFFIISQYFVLSGWTLGYFFDACTGTLASFGQDSGMIANHFSQFTTDAMRPLVFLLVFAVATAVILLGGVQKGIENVSKFLMPFLFVILLVLCVRSLTLPNASAGLHYLFYPDFSKLTGEGILAALGQALFSLSVGMGVMIVYGSYIPANDSLFKTAMWITASDTFIAVLAGVAIFPAVFSCGIDPAGGPGLVFNVLPSVFNSLGPAGSIFSSLFFLLLAVAALTSAISLLETPSAWITELKGVPRVKSVLLVSVVVVVIAVVISLSVGEWSSVLVFGDTIFDFVDKLNSIYLPPICALGTVVFLGWVMPKKDIADELSNKGTLSIGYFKAFLFLARYVAPIALLIVLVFGIINA